MNEGDIFAGHSQGRRLKGSTWFYGTPPNSSIDGAIGLAPSPRGENSRLRLHTVCGQLMHSSLTDTTERLPTE